MSTLRAWIEANPRSPALRMAQLVQTVSDDVRAFSAVRHAHVTARREVGRMGQTEENAAFDLVKRRIADLRDALDRAPLPRNQAQMLQISGPRVPDAELAFGWYEFPDGMVDGAYPLSLEAVLKLADALLQEHRDALPVRAVRRHRDRPMTAAFVHWLDYFAHRFGATLDAAQMSEIANAVLELPRKDRQTANDIRAILKTAHPKLSSAKSRP